MREEYDFSKAQGNPYSEKLKKDLTIDERDDYTKWQREYFDRLDPEIIESEALEYDKKNPYKGNANTILK